MANKIINDGHSSFIFWLDSYKYHLSSPCVAEKNTECNDSFIVGKVYSSELQAKLFSDCYSRFEATCDEPKMFRAAGMTANMAQWVLGLD